VSMDHTEPRSAFVASLTAGGYLHDRKWIAAFNAVPRHEFLPRFFTATPDGRWQGVDATHPGYLDLVYSDTTLTTQVEGTIDPDPTLGAVRGTGTSSSTQPGLMAYMLESLQISDADRVLEIGTGTGYNTALLAHRVGSANVTSMELDADLADQARARLKARGYAPSVITGDGQHGWPPYAPYDRIIATCSVPRIPHAWLRQTRSGGHIVASLWRELGGGPLVRLTVNQAAACGYFLPQSGGFMPARNYSTTARAAEVPKATEALKVAVKQHGKTRAAQLDPTVLGEPAAGLWLALLVKEVCWLGLTPTGGDEQFWLFASDGSWSMLDRVTGDVEQYGARKLWDEIECAHGLWQRYGSPERGRLGLTTAWDGSHHFWLDTPDNELWVERVPRNY
jgi:methyltransferase of ATP-grasp peptide maturase system